VNPTTLSIVRIAVGLLFIQHGAEKLWGFAGRKIDHNFLTLQGFAGPLEILGGQPHHSRPLHAPNGIHPVRSNGRRLFCGMGEPRIVFHLEWRGGSRHLLLHLSLWLLTAGPGAWSLDSMGPWEKKLATLLNPWESHGRAIVRVILAFTFMLHGYRHALGILSKSAGRAGIVPVAMIACRHLWAIGKTSAGC
jgi:putative oxidoreductase